MELLGREKELAAAGAAIAAVGEGAPRALAVMGEAGIGKSALLLAVQERAGAAGLLVLAGRAAEHERDVPFGLVVDALDDHVAAMHHRRVETIGPELAAVLPSAAAMADGDAPAAAPGDPAERFRYHRALRSLLAMMAREQPVALLLDDLHWADEASVELVLHLLRRPPAGPVLLVFAMRPVDPARRLLDAVRTGPSAELVAVEPLDHDASLALAGDIADPALRDRVARDARGNPLFLQELARAARDPSGRLPATLLAAIQLEVDALPPASRDADRRRGGRRRSLRPRAGGGRGGARPRRRARRRWTGSWPPTSSARAATRARSASATRSSCAPSTTAPRPPGGSARTSASPPSSPPAAPRPACAPTTWSSTRARATRARSRCSARRPPRRRRRRPRPPPAGTAPRSASCPTATRSAAAACSPRRPWRWPTPGSWRRAARRCSRSSACSRPARRRSSPR